MPIEMVCGCGKQLRVPEHHAGRRVQCPACAAMHLVPQASPAPPSSPAKVASRLPSLILLAILLPGLLGAAVIGWRVVVRSRATTDGVVEISLVPDDAQVCLRVRVADLWQQPRVRKAIEGVAGQVEQSTGLQPSEIDRVCFVVVDADRQIGWTLIRTINPYQRSKVLAKVVDPVEHTHEGRDFHLGIAANGNPVAVSFLTPTLLVAGSAEGVRRCLHRVAVPSVPRPDAPQTAFLTRYDGPLHILGGLHPGAGDGGRMLRQGVLAQVDEVRTLELTATVGDETLIEILAKTDDEEHAKKLHGTIKSLKDAGQGLLFLLQFKGGDQGRAAKLASKLLRQIEITEKGSDLHATLKADTDTIVEVVPLVPALMGQ